MSNVYNIAVTNTYNFTVNAYVAPNCATPASTPVAVETDLAYVDYYYHYVGNPSAPVDTANKKLNVTYNTATRPGISLTNQTGVIQAAQPTESALIRMSSTGTSTAPYTWIAFPTVTGVNISQVVDTATGTPLTLVPYTGGVWAQISNTGLASGANKYYKVDFTYTVCDSTAFTVLGGWNCTEFPTDPTAYPCGEAQTTVSFIPQIAELEITTVSQPSGAFNLCDTIMYEWNINNKQSGNVVLNTFNIEVPTGMLPITDSVKVEYPKGSGNWETVGFIQNGNIYTFNMYEHSN